MAVRAQVVGPRDGGLAPRGQPWLGAQFLLAGRCPPGQAMPPLGRRDGELQPLAERPGAGVVQAERIAISVAS
jgi:hypothetical protein